MADIAHGSGVYLAVFIEKHRKAQPGCVEDFTIEQHSKIPRRQDVRLAMLFFYGPLVAEALLILFPDHSSKPSQFTDDIFIATFQVIDPGNISTTVCCQTCNNK